VTLRNQVLEWIGNSFTIIFTLEFMLKVVGMGFVMDKHCYLRDGWNVIDFIIVVTG